MGSLSSVEVAEYQRLAVFDANAKTGSAGGSAFRIPLEVLRPLQQVYHRLIHSNDWKAWHKMGRTEETPIRALPFSFAASTPSSDFTNNMTWMWAMDEKTHALFQPLFQSILKGGFSSAFQASGSSTPELWTACFIIVKGRKVPEDQVTFHTDYASMANGPDCRPGFAFTLLTPLFELPEDVGGLECWPWAEAWKPETAAEEGFRIPYDLGKVVAVDGMLMHRTEPYDLGPGNEDFDRILVSLDVHPESPEHLASQCRESIRMQTNSNTYVRPNRWDATCDSEDAYSEDSASSSEGFSCFW